MTAVPIPVRRNAAISRLTQGTIANILNQVITAFGQIALVPVLLSCWGNQMYGEWLTLSAAVAYMTMLDFGMQLYVVNRMNQCYSRGATGEFVRILHSAILFTVVVSASAAILLLPAIAVAPLQRWFQLTVTQPSTAAIVAVLLVAQFLSFVPLGVLTGVYRSIGEYPRGATLGNVNRLLVLAVTALVAWMGGGLVALAAAQLIPPFAISGIYTVWDLRRRHPEVDIGLKRADWRLALSFLGPSWLFFLIQLALMITLQGSTLLVGAMLGAASVTVFVTLRTLANVIRQATGALYNAVWPELTSLEAQGRYDDLRKVHTLMAKALMTITACASVYLHFAGPDLVAAWTRHRVIYDAPLMTAFLLLMLSQAWWMTSSLLLISSNHHRMVSICQIGAGVSGLVLGYALCRTWGMAGVIYGLAATDLILCGWMIPRSACGMIGQSFGEFSGQVLLRGAPVLAGLAVTMDWLSRSLASAPGPLRLGLSGGLLGAASLLLAYLFWLNAAEKSRIRTFLQAGFAH
ncbi:MAG: lipopolysaccharide biosynthesis protein [Bryobacteraceae bacterium]